MFLGLPKEADPPNRCLLQGGHGPKSTIFEEKHCKNNCFGLQKAFLAPKTGPRGQIRKKTKKQNKQIDKVAILLFFGGGAAQKKNIKNKNNKNTNYDNNNNDINNNNTNIKQ